MQLGNGHWETAVFNVRLQVEKVGLGTLSTIKNILELDFGYTGADPTNTVTDRNNGSLRSQTIKVPAVGSNAAFDAVQTYAYDSLNRIESATETVSSIQTWKQTFSIDRYGNRRFDAVNTTTLGSCSTAECNPTFDVTRNRFSSGQGYSYDAEGAVTQDATGQRFGYDTENRQKEFFYATNNTSTPDGTYLYDGEGRRVKKVVGSDVTIFVYDASGQLVAEYSTQIETTDPKVSYLTTDHLGSPRIVTDENGAVISRKDFTAFGEAVTSSQRVGGNGYAEPAIRQDYTGYQRDGESGLEYAQARYYNARHGRFTSSDPLVGSGETKNPQTFNRYAYTINSPYKFTDPLGLTLMDAGIYLTSDSTLAGQLDRIWQRSFGNRILPNLRARTLGQNGITKNDRKDLQSALRKLVPGTRVNKNGEISVPRNASNSAAFRLVNGVGNSGQNVTINVTRTGDADTGAAKADGTPDMRAQLVGGVSGSIIKWNPDYKFYPEVRESPGVVKTATDPDPPEVALAHELIHAYNKARGEVAFDPFGATHYFSTFGEYHSEMINSREARAMGFAFNSEGDITEDMIRHELGLLPRASYLSRRRWSTCSLDPKSVSYGTC
jgi:RHS repeat-associated protein